MYKFKITVKTESETYRYDLFAFTSVDAISLARHRYSDAVVISAVKL